MFERSTRKVSISRAYIYDRTLYMGDKLSGRILTAVLAISFLIDAISLVAFEIESIIESRRKFSLIHRIDDIPYLGDTFITAQPMNIVPGLTCCFMSISDGEAVSDAISW